jgi:hypothetical protein
MGKETAIIDVKGENYSKENIDNMFLVIQGHAKYVDFLLKHYKNNKNIIWCTDDESEENLNKIKKSNIELVKIPNIYSGYGNVNKQIFSTMAGIVKAKEMGGKYCIKIRSDMYIDNLEKFITGCTYNNKIHMLAYVNTKLAVNGNDYKEKKIIKNGSFFKWTKKMGYTIDNLANMNYVLDFFNYGPIDEMLLFWDLPYENSEIAIPAEYKLIYRYLGLKNSNIDMSFEYLSNFFGWSLSFLKYNDIDLPSLKRNCNWKNLDHHTDRIYMGFLG